MAKDPKDLTLFIVYFLCNINPTTILLLFLLTHTLYAIHVPLSTRPHIHVLVSVSPFFDFTSRLVGYYNQLLPYSTSSRVPAQMLHLLVRFRFKKTQQNLKISSNGPMVHL